jgi:hypothetical protein
MKNAVVTGEECPESKTVEVLLGART